MEAQKGGKVCLKNASLVPVQKQISMSIEGSPGVRGYRDFEGQPDWHTVPVVPQPPAAPDRVLCPPGHYKAAGGYWVAGVAGPGREGVTGLTK